jgi:hypothetical protein
MREQRNSSPPAPASSLSLAAAHHVTVNQKVRIHNIGIKGPKEDGTGPKQVKLFINRHSFGFSDADSVPCAQQLDLTAKELDGEPITLKLTKVRGGQQPQHSSAKVAARRRQGSTVRGMLAAVAVVRHQGIPEAELQSGRW